MAIESSAVVVASVMAVSNLGGVALLMKWYMQRVDDNAKSTGQHAVLLGKAAEKLDSASATLERIQVHVDQLYRGQNDHDRNLTEINTLHEVKGCKTGLKQEGANRG